MPWWNDLVFKRLLKFDADQKFEEVPGEFNSPKDDNCVNDADDANGANGVNDSDGANDANDEISLKSQLERIYSNVNSGQRHCSYKERYFLIIYFN